MFNSLQPGCNLRQSGQALIALLVYIIITIAVTSAAVVIMITNSQGASAVYQGVATLDIAESGMENTVLRLLRDPNFTGETISVGEGISFATVSGLATKTIIATGRLGNFTRKIQVVIVYNNGNASISSWKEIP